jgi:hypothetical protein
MAAFTVKDPTNGVIAIVAAQTRRRWFTVFSPSRSPYCLFEFEESHQ